jgi:hypothetical protein
MLKEMGIDADQIDAAVKQITSMGPKQPMPLSSDSKRILGRLGQRHELDEVRVNFKRREALRKKLKPLVNRVDEAKRALGDGEITPDEFNRIATKAQQQTENILISNMENLNKQFPTTHLSPEVIAREAGHLNMFGGEPAKAMRAWRGTEDEIFRELYGVPIEKAWQALPKTKSYGKI